MIAVSAPAMFLVSALLSVLPVVARVGGAVASDGKAAAALEGRSNLTAASSLGLAFQKEMMYTQNSLCRQNYCTNPIFPGINDLPRLEALQWQCSSTSMVKQHMDFCKEAVHYDPALPSPVSKATAVSELVKAQEDAAMTMFVYHLNGMGYEAWDHQKPHESDNDCVRSVWKMVCFTYFPRAEAGCKQGEQSNYKRPCKSSCHNYLAQCGVECCDESVQCVFAHTSNSQSGQLQLLQTGYVDQEGPSAMCTGAARRSVSCSPLMLCLLVVMALYLQGCDVDIPQHEVGNWRRQSSYLNRFRYLPPGKNANSAVLNSCSQADISATLQCNGRGYCRSFSTNTQSLQSNPIAFCQCDRDYADPECGTKRKSQTTAFFWSLFLGFAGADYFYLGYPLWGMGKLLTLGGCGFWWLIDIIRTGSGPVYAVYYRTAADLPHWVAMLVVVSTFTLVGFVVAIESYLVYRRRKRDDVSLLQNAEEARHYKNTKGDLAGLDGPRFRPNGMNSFEGRPGFSGYGATMPMPHPNFGSAYASYGAANGMAGPFGPAGIPGHGSPTPASMNIAAPLHMENLGY